MQSRNSNDQRPEALNPDGRRDTERSAVPDAGGVAHQEVFDLGYGALRVVEDGNVLKTVHSDFADTPSWFPAYAAVDQFVRSRQSKTVCLSATIAGKGGAAA